MGNSESSKLDPEAVQARLDRLGVAGVRKKLPPGVIQPKELGGQSETDIALVVDVSGSMSGAIEMVKANIVEIAQNLPDGCRLSLLVYSDMADKYSYKVLSDFTDDQEALADAANSMELLGGGDSAEAQYLALAMASQKLTWLSGGLLIHITDAGPHSKQAEKKSMSSQRGHEEKFFMVELANVDYDWVHISGILQSLDVCVCSFLCNVNNTDLPYHQCASTKTGGHVFRVSGNSNNAIKDQVFALMGCLSASLETGVVDSSATEGMQLMRVNETDANAFICAEKEEDCWNQLNGVECNNVVDNEEIAEILNESFGSMFRQDASARAIKRFMKQGLDIEEYAQSLRTSARELKTVFEIILSGEGFDRLGALETSGLRNFALRAAGLENNDRVATSARDLDHELNDIELPPISIDGRGPMCSISNCDLRDVVEEFIAEEDVGLDDDSLDILTVWMASLVIGRPMLIPYKGGKFNYEDSWVLPFDAVRTGHFISLQAFLDYIECTHECEWTLQDRTALNNQAVNDLFLRDDAQNSGVLLVSDGSPFGDFVYGCLSRTPWLGLLTWLSVCRDARPVPNAVAGTLSGALMCLLKKGGLQSEAGRKAISNVCHSLQSLPWGASSANRKNIAKALLTSENLAASITVQNNVGMVKLLAILIQMPADVFAKSEYLEDFALRMFGECIDACMWMTDKTFADAIGDPVINDFTIEPNTWHELEKDDGELPDFQLRLEQFAPVLEAAKRTFNDILAVTELKCADIADGMMKVLLLESIYVGKSGRADVEIKTVDDVKTKTISSTLQSIPRSADEIQSMTRFYVRSFLRQKYKENLIGLRLVRERQLIETEAIPNLVNEVMRGIDNGVLAAKLNLRYQSDFVKEGVFIGMHNVLSILETLAEKGFSLPFEQFMILSVGRVTIEAEPIFGDGKMCNDTDAIMQFVQRFYTDSVEAKMEKIQEFWDSKNPSSTPPYFGSIRFNNHMIRMANKVLNSVGKPPSGNVYKLTREDVREAKRNGLDIVASRIILRYGDATFKVNRIGHHICWSVGPYEREDRSSQEDGKAWYPWPKAINGKN